MSCHTYYIPNVCLWLYLFDSLYIGRSLEIIATLQAHVFIVILTQVSDWQHIQGRVPQGTYWGGTFHLNGW